MKRVKVATRQGSANVCASRWLARALLVVGGALAGTAIGWAISDASASAAAVTDPTQVTGQLAQGLSQLTGPAGPLDVRLAPPERVAVDVPDTLDNVAHDAVLHPSEDLLGSVNRIVEKPRDLDLPRVIGNALVPPRTVLGVVATSTGQLVSVSGSSTKTLSSPEPDTTSGSPAQANTVPPVSGSHPLDQARTRALAGEPRPVPSAPTRELPLPADLPAVPNGAASGGHVDGPFLGVPTSILIIVPDEAAHGISIGTRPLPAQPGAQPGVTPD